ncbi:transcriptional regulator, TetR family [Sphingobium faniae]|nr:transcriptional regulator, TetR family [Sphingobium faniae]
MQETKRRKPLDWRTVADAAIALADEVGLERLSLRAVAERLHVTPMALYKHISDKTELDAIVAAEVLDRSMNELQFAPGAPWREVLRESAVEMHRAFQLRPRLLPIFIQYPYHPKSQRLGGQMIAALMRTGVHAKRAEQLFSMLSILVVGEILTRHHFATGRTSSGFDRAQREALPNPPVADSMIVHRMMDFEDMLDLQLDLFAIEIARSTSADATESATQR